MSVIGANGAGKSTILRAISGLVPISSGDIEFLGKPIKGLPINRIVSLGIAHVPEGRRLFPYMSVLANIKLGAYLRKDKRDIAGGPRKGLRAVSPAEGEACPESGELERR